MLYEGPTLAETQTTRFSTNYESRLCTGSQMYAFLSLAVGSAHDA